MSTKVAAILATYPQDFLSTGEVAGILGVSNWAVYKRVERFTIPFSYVGTGRLVFLRSSLRSWAEARPELDRAL